MPSPVELEAAAARLRTQARGLPELVDAPIARAGCDVWQGPAQAQLWNELHWWRQRLVRAAEELSATAYRLEEEAERIRASEAEARRREADQQRLRERAAASAVPGRAGVR